MEEILNAVEKIKKEIEKEIKEDKKTIHLNMNPLFLNLNSKLNAHEKNEIIEEISRQFFGNGSNSIKEKANGTVSLGEAKNIVNQINNLINKMEKSMERKEENVISQNFTVPAPNINLGNYYSSPSVTDGASGIVSDDGVINPEEIKETQKKQPEENAPVWDGASGIISDDGVINPDELENLGVNEKPVQKIDKEVINDEKIEEDIKKAEEINENTEEIKEDEIDIDALTQEYEDIAKEVRKYIENNNSKLNIANLHRERLVEQREEVLKTEPNNKALIEEYDKKIKEQDEVIRKIKNPTKEEQIKEREEKDKFYRTIETKKQVLASYIRKLEAENRKLEFEVSEMTYNGIKDYKEWNEKLNKIKDNKYKIDKMSDLIVKYDEVKEELKKTEKTYSFEEIKKIGEDKPEDNTTTPSGSTEDDSTPKDDDDLDLGSLSDRDKIKAAIDKLKDSLLNVPEEKRADIISKIGELVLALYEKDQNAFLGKLAEAKTVDEKLEMIDRRMDQIDNIYGKLFDSENAEIANMLLEEKERVLEEIKNRFAKSKEAGEYCFKEYENIVASRDYIYGTIKDEDLKNQFYDLLDTMGEIIVSPDKEKYDNWRRNMKEFAENTGLDPEKMTPYLTANAKMKNPNVSVDKDFNINGLDLDKEKVHPTPGPNPTPNPIPGKKKGVRRKVVSVAKKAFKWMKEHKLVCIAIGLALTTALMFAIPGTHMMINSALWSLGKSLGWSASSLNSLHSVNLGLATAVKGGKYAFEGASGLYTLGGVAGAKALYSSAGAGLIASLTGLGALGTLGTTIAAIVSKIKNRNKPKKEIIEEEIELEPEEEIIEEDLEKENTKTKDLDKENEELKTKVATLEAELLKSNKRIEMLLEEMKKGKVVDQTPEETELNNEELTEEEIQKLAEEGRSLGKHL